MCTYRCMCTSVCGSLHTFGLCWLCNYSGGEGFPRSCQPCQYIPAGGTQAVGSHTWWDRGWEQEGDDEHLGPCTSIEPKSPALPLASSSYHSDSKACSLWSPDALEPKERAVLPNGHTPCFWASVHLFLIVCRWALVSSSAVCQQWLFQTSLIVSVPVARCLHDEMEGSKSDGD